MAVGTLRTGLISPRWLIWGVTCLGLLWKMNIFLSICLEICINGCWNSQHRAHFSKTINLRGHMPRFTLKNEHFPLIYLLRTPNTINVCWNPQNRACFPRRSIWGVTCLGLCSKNEHAFVHCYVLGKTINVCWNPQNRACFSKTIDLRVTCLGLL